MAHYIEHIVVVICIVLCALDLFSVNATDVGQKQNPAPPNKQDLPIDFKTTTPWPELGSKRAGNRSNNPTPQQPTSSRRDFVANPSNVGSGSVSTGNPQPTSNRRDFVPSPNSGQLGNVHNNIQNLQNLLYSYGKNELTPNNPTNVAGQNVPTNTRDYVAPKPQPTPNAANNKPIQKNTQTTTPASRRDYVAKPLPQNTHQLTTPANRRDYVANSVPNKPLPQNTQLSTSVNRRDFVADPKPSTANSKPLPQNTQTTTPSSRRDFVANVPPQPSPMKPQLSYSAIAQKNSVPGAKPVSPTGPPQTNTQQEVPAAGKEKDDNDLREFSEALLKKDVNNAAKYVTIDYQGKTRSGSLKDEAPKQLLTIKEDAYKIPSIMKMILLHNNYILETNQNEVYTANEKLEENDFLDTILPTPVMQYTRNFLVDKGKISKNPKDFRDLLKTIWFNMYSRGGGRIGSSGFEHVFLAELKNDDVSGLHNWLYFNDEEKKNRVNYLGYMKKLDFEKGVILKYHFNFHNKDKPVGSMFIGTSPEFEIALYSTCFLLRPDDVCPLRLGGQNFIIRTYTYRYRGKNMIGSAFPDI